MVTVASGDETEEALHLLPVVTRLQWATADDGANVARYCPTTAGPTRDGYDGRLRVAGPKRRITVSRRVAVGSVEHEWVVFPPTEVSFRWRSPPSMQYDGNRLNVNSVSPAE